MKRKFEIYYQTATTVVIEIDDKDMSEDEISDKLVDEGWNILVHGKTNFGKITDIDVYDDIKEEIT